MSHTDFEYYTQEELTDLHSTARTALKDLIANKRPVKFVIDGDVVSYSLIELPQLRRFVGDVGTALEIKNNQAAGGGPIHAFKITSCSKGL